MDDFDKYSQKINSFIGAFSWEIVQELKANDDKRTGHREDHKDRE